MENKLNFVFKNKNVLNVTWQTSTDDSGESFGTDILSGIVINSRSPLQ